MGMEKIYSLQGGYSNVIGTKRSDITQISLFQKLLHSAGIRASGLCAKSHANATNLTIT
jgi:hypothetical protein